MHVLIRVRITAFRLGIFAGFASFFIMEKTLRVLGGEDGHSHSHSSDAHEHEHDDTSASGHTSGVAVANSEGLRARTTNGTVEPTELEYRHPEEEEKHTNSSKLSAYLNLFGDFVHNMYALAHSGISNIQLSIFHFQH